MIDNEHPAEVELDETFEEHGLKFRYPGFWNVETEAAEGKLAVTVMTEGTAFWMLSVVPGEYRGAEVLDSAIDTFREEYDEIDVYERQQPEEALWTSQDLDVVCQELITSVSLRAIELDGCCLFLLYQGQDADLKQQRPTFDAMTASLRVVPGEFF